MLGDLWEGHWRGGVRIWIGDVELWCMWVSGWGVSSDDLDIGVDFDVGV